MSSYVVNRPSHIDGRTAARFNLHKPVNQESALSNLLFGWAVAGATFVMIWIVWRGLAPMFMEIWQKLAA